MRGGGLAEEDVDEDGEEEGGRCERYKRETIPGSGSESERVERSNLIPIGSFRPAIPNPIEGLKKLFRETRKKKIKNRINLSRSPNVRRSSSDLSFSHCFPARVFSLLRPRRGLQALH